MDKAFLYVPLPETEASKVLAFWRENGIKWSVPHITIAASFNFRDDRLPGLEKLCDFISTIRKFRIEWRRLRIKEFKKKKFVLLLTEEADSLLSLNGAVVDLLNLPVPYQPHLTLGHLREDEATGRFLSTARSLIGTLSGFTAESVIVAGGAEEGRWDIIKTIALRS